MDTTKGGTEGQVGANGANEPETGSTSPSVAAMIVIELDSEDFREPSEAGLMLTPPVRVVLFIRISLSGMVLIKSFKSKWIALTGSWQSLIMMRVVS